MAGLAREERRSTQDLDISDLGRPDTLRYNVLTFVINEEYDRAINYLKEFLEMDSPYPSFKLKVERYVQHSIDLIFAIRTKRNFPGFNSLTRTKQQELKEKFKEHFQELKYVIGKIEKSLEELRLNDIKSTKIVMKSVWASLLIVFVSTLVIDFTTGLGKTFYVVFDEYIGLALDYLYQTLKLF
jgi:hypothetical protein